MLCDRERGARVKNPDGNRIAVTAPMRPLCAPLDVHQGFAAEIIKNASFREKRASFRQKMPRILSKFFEIPDRRAPRTAAPWERLGLVYLEERGAAPERPKSNMLVNNLTQQIIFRIFLTNRSRKPAEWDQAGFLLLKKIFRKIAKAPGTAVWRRDFVRLSGAEQGMIDLKELHTALRTLLKQTEENESAGVFSEISEEKLKRTFTKILRGISERSRTAVSPDIRIMRQERSLLKLLTVRYADRFPKEPPASASPKKMIADLSALLPPAQTDGVRAKDDYARPLPPIEYRREQPREQAGSMPSQRPRVVNRRQTQTGTPVITGRLENFSREEINRLADQIYTQIETRVLRERRRAGM